MLIAAQLIEINDRIRRINEIEEAKELAMEPEEMRQVTVSKGLDCQPGIRTPIC
jgi:hypothetical protein